MSNELEVKITYRQQFCEGTGDCPLRQAFNRLKGVTDIEVAKEICRDSGLEDFSNRYASGLPPELTQNIFVSACTRRLPSEGNYTDCGSMFAELKAGKP